MTHRRPCTLHLLVAVMLLAVSATAEEAKQSLTIVAFGDSTTAARDGVKQVYSVRLTNLLKQAGVEATVVNAGVAGSHTGRLSDNARFRRPHALDRLDEAVRSHKPDIVIVQFGWNDSWVDSNQRDGPSRIALEDYAKNLKHIIGSLTEDGARVILMTPNRPRTTIDAWRVQRTLRYVAAVRKLANEESIPLIDVWAAYEQYAVKNRQSVDRLLLDSLHPNDLGHELVARHLLPVIAAEGGLIQGQR